MEIIWKQLITALVAVVVAEAVVVVEVVGSIGKFACMILWYKNL
jgi:hypothetical protein